MFNELIKELEKAKEELERELVSKDKDHEAEFFRNFSENYNIHGGFLGFLISYIWCKWVKQTKNYRFYDCVNLYKL